MKPSALSGFGGSSVPSPCVRLCQIDAETRLCIGCQRTVSEIASWSFISDPERQRVLAEVEKRRENASVSAPPSLSPKP